LQAGKTSVFSFQFSFLSPYNKAPARSGQPRGRFGVFSGAIARFAPPYPGKKDRLQFAAECAMMQIEMILNSSIRQTGHSGKRDFPLWPYAVIGGLCRLGRLPAYRLSNHLQM
jgi:hypothetical protein